MAKPKSKASSAKASAGSPAKEQPEKIDIPAPQAPVVPEMSAPAVPEIEMTHPHEQTSEDTTPPKATRPLTEDEALIRDAVVDEVLAQIDPLLVKLKEIAEQAEGAGQHTAPTSEQMASEYEALVEQMTVQMNQRIERKISNFKAFIARKG